MPDPTCKVCNRGVIGWTKVYRMPALVVFFGYGLLLASAVGVVLVAIGELNAPAADQNPLQVGLAMAGQAMRGCLFFVSLGGGLAGVLLVLKKNVLKCGQCGVELPASLEPK